MRSGAWLGSIAFGALATLIIRSVGLLFGGLIASLLLPLIFTRVARPAVDGLLVGFGGSWLIGLILEADQPSAISGGLPETAWFWWAMGVLPLVAGSLWIVARALHRAYRNAHY